MPVYLITVIALGIIGFYVAVFRLVRAFFRRNSFGTVLTLAVVSAIVAMVEDRRFDLLRSSVTKLPPCFSRVCSFHVILEPGLIVNLFR